MIKKQDESENSGNINQTTYLVLGMCFGAGFGITVGSAYDVVPIGLSLGAGLGMIVGLLAFKIKKES